MLTRTSKPPRKHSEATTKYKGTNERRGLGAAVAPNLNKVRPLETMGGFRGVAPYAPP